MRHVINIGNLKHDIIKRYHYILLDDDNKFHLEKDDIVGYDCDTYGRSVGIITNITKEGYIVNNLTNYHKTTIEPEYCQLVVLSSNPNINHEGSYIGKLPTDFETSEYCLVFTQSPLIIKEQPTNVNNNSIYECPICGESHLKDRFSVIEAECDKCYIFKMIPVSNLDANERLERLQFILAKEFNYSSRKYLIEALGGTINYEEYQQSNVLFVPVRHIKNDDIDDIDDSPF